MCLLFRQNNQSFLNVLIRVLCSWYRRETSLIRETDKLRHFRLQVNPLFHFMSSNITVTQSIAICDETITDKGILKLKYHCHLTTLLKNLLNHFHCTNGRFSFIVILPWLHADFYWNTTLASMAPATLGE